MRHLLALTFLSATSVESFIVPKKTFVASSPKRKIRTESHVSSSNIFDEEQQEDKHSPKRRDIFSTFISSIVLPSLSTMTSQNANAISTSDATITDRIFIELKGVPAPPPPSSEDDPPATPSSIPNTTDRITIGLFGKNAPRSVSILKSLVTPTGLPSSCRPLDTSRTLQLEQLEANKVYKMCKEGEEKGVTYDLSTVWRIEKDVRLDFGSVAGRFVSRTFPDFYEDSSEGETLKHDTMGVVSVRKGNESGFGFTIYPGKIPSKELDEDYIVVGKVLEGMDVIERLNEAAVVKSSKINYMSLVDGGREAKSRKAPSRSCRYGGDMYCNEMKPLRKIMISKTGLLL